MRSTADDDGPAARPSGQASGEAAELPVVAIGASAGGLEALRQLLPHVPSDSGMAFVVILHLDPGRPSMLARVLDGLTPLSVVEATDGMPLVPDRVHVIPPDADLSIRDRTLTLVDRRATGGLHLPIDTFFRALAEDRRGSAIGVVLSGSGRDGTEGLRAIKAAGGIAMAQEPGSAQFTSMPESAIAAGNVDFRGSPAAIAAELARLGRHPYLVARGRGDEEPPRSSEQEERLAAALALVRERAGVDFSGYKRTTVWRRIERRMALRRAGGLAEYLESLHDDPDEVRALAQDILIHVTSFFRDPEAFVALEELVLRELVERKRREAGEIRVWVPGCSTGEEAYSLAICLLEALGPSPAGDELSIKVFGTDLSEEAIRTARVGRYPGAITADVSPERLARFFDPVDGTYQVGRRVRDHCVFVRHDLTRDPPFAKLDLISCRNVLIYFDAELQRRVIPVLHYCLNERGHLFLGHSETIAGFRELFAPVDRAHRIFIKTGDSRRLILTHVPGGREADVSAPELPPAKVQRPAREAEREADHLLLARYAPPGVLVNDRLEIVQFRGRTGAYLEPPPGQPQANVLRMAREGLAAHLHEALERARAESVTVRKEGLRLQVGQETRGLNLEVVPLTRSPGSAARHFLVVFEELGTGITSPARGAPAGAELQPDAAAAEIDRLRAELVATRDYVQSLVSDHQVTSDELAATNEELIAANEELQSTNEELQSAKEELQSTNEELSTLNDELRQRNHALDQLASDLVNVLSSVELPLIIVDLELRVRRFTPTAREVANLIQDDVGRPLEDLKLKVHVPDVTGKIREVVDSLTPSQSEVQGQDGRWFRMHIRPYRTTDQRLDGAVLSFVDIDALRRALTAVEAARDYARSIVETVTEALVVLDAGLRVVSANETFCRTLVRPPRAAEGVSLFELGRGMWDEAVVRRALEEALGEGKPFTGLELQVTLPEVGPRTLSLTGRRLPSSGQPADEGTPRILLAMVDVTELRRLETERAQLLESETRARREAERANQAKDLFLATLSHELRSPLGSMLTWAEYLQRVSSTDPRVVNASAAIERAARSQARLIEDLLDVSRIASGKLLLDLGPVDLEAVTRAAVEVARPSAEAKGVDLQLAVEAPIGLVYGDATRLQQVAQNLLANAVKFTPRGGHVSVRLERQDERAQLTVADTGMGIRPEVVPRLFGRFVQADSSVTRTHGGLGLGLSIVLHLVEVHGGHVTAESPGEGKGATFRVTLPLGGPATGAEGGRAAPATRSIEGVRVLLVDDDDETRAGFATMLTELGAEVRAVGSAAAGLAALGEFRPHVLLSDLAMPVEDGFNFIGKVRGLPPERGGRVPAAAVSALASDEDRRRALAAGFQLHVAKPVDAARLATVVATLAEGGAPAGSR